MPFCHYVYFISSTAVGQAVACALVTQRARVRYPVGTGFLGEVLSGFSSPVRQMSGSFRPPRFPNFIWPSLSSSIIIHYGRQWPEMLTRPKTSNIHTYIFYFIVPSFIIIRSILYFESILRAICICVSIFVFWFFIQCILFYCIVFYFIP